MSDPKHHDLTVQLQVIERDVRQIQSTLDRLLIGQGGDSGLIDRVARHEERLQMVAG